MNGTDDMQGRNDPDDVAARGGHPDPAEQPETIRIRRDDADIAPRPSGDTEIVPWTGGDVAPRGGGTPGPAGPGQGEYPGGAAPAGRPDGERKNSRAVVRVPRGILVVLVCLLLVAVAVIVVLVRRPTVATAGPALATPTARPTAASGEPSPSATQASPESSASAVSSPAASPGGSPAPANGPVPGSVNLAGLTPRSAYYVGSYVTGPTQIGNTSYPSSVRFTCEQSPGSSANVVYDVAGYQYLNATLGVPSDATNAAGNTMTITFFKDGSTAQLGKTVTISLDHPQGLHLNLQGSSQLEVACVATNAASNSPTAMDVALGSAVLTH